MITTDLPGTARALACRGKGILAADETEHSITKRLDTFAVESTADNRRAYRELFFATPGIADFVSGVIMHDETIRQQSSKGVPFADLVAQQGMLPGIRVDNGAVPFASGPGSEFITEGLDGLRDRLDEYRALGASFAEWRTVIAISDTAPTSACVIANAHALARYAALCQEQGLLPIVEPEVLMDGSHTLDRCEQVTAAVLRAVFNALLDQHVALEGLLLRPNMVLPGTECPSQALPHEVAATTVRTLRRHVPAAVPGIVFLSGGQDHRTATLHLNLINQVDAPKPWPLTFSYGRALQHEALAAWQGMAGNLKEAQRVFYHRARCGSAAALGRYSPSMENDSAVA